MFGQENTGQLELSEFGVCSYYLRGTCRRGGECQLLHPPELSIKLQPKEDFTVSTATGQACQRCLERMVPCDKVGRRNDETDPCSECRHFGGVGAKCVLWEGHSQSSVMWQAMLGNKDQNYALPAHKRRDKDRKLRGMAIKTAPMGDDEVRNWAGVSRDDLMKTPDMLPADVRQRPRAYLTPPPLTHQQEKSRQHFDKQRHQEGIGAQPKRRFDDMSGMVQPTAPQYMLPASLMSGIARPKAPQNMLPAYPMPDIPVPSPDAYGNSADTVTFKLVNGVYASVTVAYPASNGGKGNEVTSFPASPFPPSRRFQQQNAASNSFGGPRAQVMAPQAKKRRPMPAPTSVNEAQQQMTQPSRTLPEDMDVDTQVPSAESDDAVAGPQAVPTHVEAETAASADDDDKDSVGYQPSDADAAIDDLAQDGDDNDSVGFQASDENDSVAFKGTD